jgi:protein SCO1/2
MRSYLSALGVLVLGCATLWIATDGLHAFTSEQARRLSILEHPRTLPDVWLEDQDGRLFRLAEYQGSKVLVDFFFARCTTLCLAMGSTFQRLAHHLPGNDFKMLSISFDPETDTPEVLKAYAQRFNADGISWRFARIHDQGDLRSLLDAFGVVVIADPVVRFQHNAAVHLVNREGRLVQVFDFDDVETITQSLTAAY